MTDVIIRGSFVLFIIYVAARGWQVMRGGVLRIRGTSEPLQVITRDERPVAYWSFVIFFYLIMLVIIGTALFVPWRGQA